MCKDGHPTTIVSAPTTVVRDTVVGKKVKLVLYSELGSAPTVS